jgi:GNAT superfamily N-acetyltransferase
MHVPVTRAILADGDDGGPREKDARAMHQLVKRIRSPEENTIPPKFELRPLTSLSDGELLEATTMLASAFDQYPLFHLAFPEDSVRRKILRTLFTTVLQDAVRFGRVEIALSHKIVGMLIWYPPGRYPMSVFRILRSWPHYARFVAASPRGVLTLFRAQTTLNRWRPQKPHCYGYFLGGNQGERVGTVLARSLLRRADDEGWPIYLETQDRRCIGFYARMGFKILQDGVETLPGGPVTWTMWREPQAETACRQTNIKAPFDHLVSA